MSKHMHGTIVFVGDKPSKKNKFPGVPFVGTRSYRTLLEWIYRMDIDISLVKMVNQDMLDYCYVSGWLSYNHVDICRNEPSVKIIALGKNAAEKLDSLYVGEFWELPHPSGLNRRLNNKKYVDAILKSCKDYIYGGR